jgi:anthranilate synthase component 1
MKLHFKKILTNISPTELYMKINSEYEYSFLLESINEPHKLAQYSFLGFNPQTILVAKNKKVTIQNSQTDNEIIVKSEDPIDIVKKVIGKKNPPKTFRYEGGGVGYISYDSVRYWEELPNKNQDDLQFPDIQFGIYNDGVVFDHEELVKNAKCFIYSGDIFQVVLSKRHEYEYSGDLFKFYLTLRQMNPSPYMYFLKMRDYNIIGSSPEMLIRVNQRLVETFPIAGTCPRVKDRKKSEKLAQTLLSDPKERAEHVMLVDLARNDIGRIAEFGSVYVPEFMKISQYSHVQHIVSRVVGKLDKKYDSYDALKAVFPAGTVSGAPKIRAMEIIEESEPTRRGPYGGAVGYFSYNGNSDFAITIRTLIAQKDKCFVQAGGGIVADSLPEKEWFETEYKSRALIKALEFSELK